MAGRKCGERIGDRLFEPVCLHKSPIGLCGGGEAGRHSYPLRTEMGHHLAERGILAADAGNVVLSQLFKPDHMGGI